MLIRPLMLLAAATAALAPCVSGASPEQAALKACAQAFASSIASPGTASPDFKLDYRGSQGDSVIADYYNRKYTFTLQAHDSKTGLTVASATCSASTRGTNVALTPTAVDAASAKLAAQL
jgi:hypothetical protein